MLLVQVTQSKQTEDRGNICTLLTAPVVRPEPLAGHSSLTDYVKVNRTDLPDDYVPSGPLELTEYPNGSESVLTVEQFQIAEVLHGPVLFFFLFYDSSFDATPFLQKVYVVKGCGKIGPEPLL